MSGILVIGAGPAAHRFVARLRQHGHRGPVTVIGAEARPPYNRMLVPSVLSGSLTPNCIALPDLDARLRLGTSATRIDRERREVHADDGAVYRYDTLVLATGARPADQGSRDGVTPLRTLADCALVTGRRILVLGGGILGMQAALALCRRGHDVSVVHRHAVLMNRLLDAEAGRILASRLQDLGIRVYLGRTAARYRTGGVTLDDCTTVLTDRVLLCTGAVPNVELARQCGLTVDDGVVVDTHLRTDDPDIHAVGDCAQHDDQPGHLSRAWDQADALAAFLTVGHAGYRAGGRVTRLTGPGIDIASVGIPAPSTVDSAVEVVALTDPARDRYARLTLRDGRIAGAVLVGLPEAIATISQLYDRGEPAPSDRLGLLLGGPVTPTGPVELSDDAVVCVCNNVTKITLVRAWRGGAETVNDLATSTRATTGCGTCTSVVQGICSTLSAERQGA
jgi:assimilatory nitrate reductase electron transfer subunit